MPSPSIATLDYSLLVGQSPDSVFPPGLLNSRRWLYMMLWNVSTTNTLWLSRAGAAAVGQPGSFPIGPGQYQLFTTPQAIPTNPLSVISTGTSTPFTVEVG
jgi:hypothetical protein